MQIHIPGTIRGPSVLAAAAPVSYTHLDVYKRQDISRTRRGGPHQHEQCGRGQNRGTSDRARDVNLHSCPLAVL